MKARLVQALVVTQSLVRSQASMPRNLLPVLQVLRLLSANGGFIKASITNFVFNQHLEEMILYLLSQIIQESLNFRNIKNILSDKGKNLCSYACFSVYCMRKLTKIFMFKYAYKHS